MYVLILAPILIFSKISPMYLKIFPLLLDVQYVLVLFIIIGEVSIQIKRLHDLNFSGWWLLVAALLTAPGGLAIDPRINLPLPEPLRYILIAVNIVIGLSFMVSCFFIKGSKGENKYGKDPLE